VARSLWAVIVDPDSGDELPDGQVGEVWLQGNNIGRGYWNRIEETRRTFGATLRSRLAADSHAAGARLDGNWLRTGDFGVYLGGELYITGRIADLVTIDGRDHYPQHIESTAAQASPMVRRGYAAAFTVSAPTGEELVIVAERAAGTNRADPQEAVQAIRSAVWLRHGLSINDVRLVPAGSIPRTTSGKLARRACRAEYLAGVTA
jgi:fatty-acyl-CoA synthase